MTPGSAELRRDLRLAVSLQPATMASGVALLIAGFGLRWAFRGMNRRASACFVVMLALGSTVSADARVSTSPDKAAAALRKAAAFYRTRVAAHGGYVYHYSLDLHHRWGEGAGSIR